MKNGFVAASIMAASLALPPPMPQWGDVYVGGGFSGKDPNYQGRRGKRSKAERNARKAKRRQRAKR
jgi:hypothetical protein